MRGLVRGLAAMLKTQQHTDIIINVGEKSFPCHKVILSAISPFFEAMFSHDVRETRDGVVNLRDLDAETFEDMLQFLYCGQDVVNVTNAEKLFHAASLLQIECLQERCEDFLITGVTSENCVGIWRIARSHNCSNLKQKSWEAMVDNFQYVVHSDDFLDMDIDELCLAVGSRDIVVPNEEFVCDTVIAWMNRDFEARKIHIDRILEILRLPLVSAEYMFHSFVGSRLSHYANKGRVCIDEALKYHSCSNKRQSFTSERTMFRRKSSMNNVLVVIGGLLTTTPRFETTKDVQCFSFQQKRWFSLPALPYDPGYEYAVCTHGDNILLSGGWLKLQGLVEYKVHKNKWKIHQQMTNGRCGHVMVSVSNSVYVFGGRDGRAPALTNIEEYNLLTKKWNSVGEMVTGVRSMSVCAVGEKVFVFGGITENDKDTMMIQAFDTRLRTSIVVGNLPFPCRLTRTVVCEETIIVILPGGRCLWIDATELSSAYETAMEKTNQNEEPSSSAIGQVKDRISNFNQHHFEAIQHGGKLLLIGGKKSDNSILKKIVFVDVDKNEETDELDMPSPRWCFGCVKTVTRTEYLNNSVAPA